MKTNRVIASALLLTILFAATGDVTFAATKKSKTTKVETVDPVKEATVNLYCRMRVGKTIYATSGSGVFVSESGIILTNAHVAQDFLLSGADKRIDGWCSVRTGSPANERYTAKVLYLPAAWVQDNAAQLAKGKPRGTGENDFALLYVTGPEKKGTLPAKFPAIPLNLLGTVTENMGVTVVGYPTGNLSFSQVRNKLPVVTASTTVTNVRSFSGATQDVITLASSAAGGYGSSGGPTIDTSGTLIGLITSKGSEESSSTLRSITIPYIDRSLRAQTGFPLTTILSSSPALLAPSLNAGISPEILKILAGGLINKNKR